MVHQMWWLLPSDTCHSSHLEFKGRFTRSCTVLPEDTFCLQCLLVFTAILAFLNGMPRFRIAGMYQYAKKPCHIYWCFSYHHLVSFSRGKKKKNRHVRNSGSELEGLKITFQILFLMSSHKLNTNQHHQQALSKEKYFPLLIIKHSLPDKAC